MEPSLIILDDGNGMTENEIRHYIGAINNMENIARNSAINNAFETIKDIQKNQV